MSASLEDQRRVLLEQIEASRAVYRRMLTGESPAGSGRRSWTVRQASAAGGAGNIAEPAVGTGPLPGRLPGRPLPGGRSKAVQWAMDHPLWVAGGVALLVLLLPRAVEARQRRARKAKMQTKLRAALPAADTYLQSEPRGSGAGRALLATALLLLRDPARLQSAGRLAGIAWRWLQSRRPPSVHGPGRP